MKKKIINIYTNDTDVSNETEKLLRLKLDAAGFAVSQVFNPNAELLICIGGDGAFLKAMHAFDFPQMPIIGINTGHLGFFQELPPENMDQFIAEYKAGEYTLQNLTTVKVTIFAEGRREEHIALNEISIKGSNSYNVHLTLSIGSSFIERFSGDGLIVATPAGSTAYNYSLGGSIADPRIELLQVTPIAPMNTTAYRSLTSSILLPSDLKLNIVPEMPDDIPILVVRDGREFSYSNIDKLRIEYSDKSIKLLRSPNYDFWNKVKTKFL